MPYKQALKSIHKDNFSKLLLDIQWKILSKALQTIFKKEVKHRFNSLFNLGFWLLVIKGRPSICFIDPHFDKIL